MRLWAFHTQTTPTLSHKTTWMQTHTWSEEKKKSGVFLFAWIRYLGEPLPIQLWASHLGFEQVRRQQWFRRRCRPLHHAPHKIVIIAKPNKTNKGFIRLAKILLNDSYSARYFILCLATLCVFRHLFYKIPKHASKIIQLKGSLLLLLLLLPWPKSNKRTQAGSRSQPSLRLLWCFKVMAIGSFHIKRYRII